MRLISKKILKLLFAASCCMACINASAQDIHFSQFYCAPLVINPAKTGNFNGDYRFTGIHRNQWKSVTVPYKTFSGSFDMRINEAEENTGFLSAGIVFNNDKAGDSDFGLTEGALSIAYSFYLDKDKKNMVTAALQPAFAQKSINYGNLTFDSQYNGDVFDANAPTNETFNKSSITYFDINAGLHFRHVNEDKFAVSGGLGMQHLNKPEQNFFSDKVSLFPRYALDLNLGIKASERIYVLPSVLYQMQGKFTELNGGANIKLALSKNERNEMAIYLGGFFRTKDAGIARVGVDYNNLHLSFAYDFNTSDLDRASNGKGGYEMALVYIFKKVKPLKINPPCPVY